MGYDKKIITLINIVSQKVKTFDFKRFCSVEQAHNKGGVRSISVPELNIEDHLIMWSKMYGVLAISRKPINEETSIANGRRLFFGFSIPFLRS